MATGPHNSLLVSDRALGAGAGGKKVHILQQEALRRLRIELPAYFVSLQVRTAFTYRNEKNKNSAYLVQEQQWTQLSFCSELKRQLSPF